MGRKRAIIVAGRDQKIADLVQTQVGASLNKLRAKENGISHINTKFAQTFNDSVCKQFGLMHSYSGYQNHPNQGSDFMIKEQQEFFGHVPNQVFTELHQYFSDRFGPGFLGRTLCRRIINETIANLFVLSDLPNYESLLAVALEVGPENVMLIQLDGHDLDLEAHQVYPIKNVQFKYIQTEDKELMRILVRGVVMSFTGLEE